jgi:O-antigen ligase
MRFLVTTLAGALALVTTASGAYSAWYVIGLGHRRVQIPDFIDPIIFGGLTLLLGLCCLAALPAARPWRLRLMLAIGVFAGLLAAALSGTRGAWVALPVGLLILDRYQWRLLGAAWRWGAMALVVVSVTMLVAWPDTGVKDRAMSAYSAISHSLTTDEPGGSGFWYRPTLYRTVALEIVPASPWVGHGPVNLRLKLQALAERDEASPALKRLARARDATQAHNDGLQALFWGGVFGLVGLLVAYMLPLVLFRQAALVTADAIRRALAVMGLLVAGLYIVFGVSYSYFAFVIPTVFYLAAVFLIALLVRGTSSTQPL